MNDQGKDYDQLLALHHAMQLRRSLRDDGPRAPRRRNRPTEYPQRRDDQALMVESLEAIGAAADEVVRAFYAHLFTDRPFLRNMFPADLHPDTDRLFNALIGLAEALDDLRHLVPILEQLGRDHRKYGLRPAHYDAVRDALVTSLSTHGGPDWRVEYEEAWTRAYDFAAGIMQAAETASTDPPFWQGTVVEHELRYHDIAVLRVRTDVPYRYRAGQYTTVELPQLPRVWRPYSMATAPRPDGLLEFHVRAIKGGGISSVLVHDTRAGDPLRLGAPRGTAVLETTGTAGVLCVAGGTGLAPCRAVVEQVLTTQPGRPVQLVFGVRHVAELYDLPILSQLANHYPALTLVPVVTEEEDFPGLQGQLPELITASGPWDDHEVYVCGPPGMVGAVDRTLRRMGVPSDVVHHDPVP
ncbi:MAG: globin domain-containing protein [Actinocatenispora sp.]